MDGRPREFTLTLKVGDSKDEPTTDLWNGYIELAHHMRLPQIALVGIACTETLASS